MPYYSKYIYVIATEKFSCWLSWVNPTIILKSNMNFWMMVQAGDEHRFDNVVYLILCMGIGIYDCQDILEWCIPAQAIISAPQFPFHPQHNLGRTVNSQFPGLLFLESPALKLDSVCGLFMSWVLSQPIFYTFDSLYSSVCQSQILGPVNFNELRVNCTAYWCTESINEPYQFLSNCMLSG